MHTLTYSEGHDLSIGDLRGRTVYGEPLQVVDVEGARVTFAIPATVEQYQAAQQRAFMAELMPQVEHPAFFGSQSAKPPCRGTIHDGIPAHQHTWRGTLAEWFEAVAAANQAVDDETVSEANRAEARALLAAAAGVYAHL